MERIIVGEEYIGKEEESRETCFGILYKNKKFKCVSINDEVSLIGGGIEKNESHEDTLKREFKEEAGLLIEVNNPLFVIDCYWKTRNNIIMHSIANIYEVEEVGKTDIEEKNAKVVEFNSDEVLEYLPLPYHKKAIKEYLKIPTVIEKEIDDIQIIMNESKKEFNNVLIYVHGLGSSKDMINRYGRKLARNNIAICAFDLPGHGKDKKTFKEFNLNTSLLYLEKVINDIEENYKKCKISLFGSSYGAYVILNYLKKNNKYKAFLMSPAVNFPDILKEKGGITKDYFKNKEYKALYGNVKIYEDAFNNFCDNEVSLKNNNFKNVKIVHGSNDTTVKIDVIKRFCELNNIELKIIENEAHELYSSNSIIVNFIIENI